MAEPDGFDQFVVARSPALLRLVGMDRSVRRLTDPVAVTAAVAGIVRAPPTSARHGSTPTAVSCGSGCVTGPWWCGTGPGPGG